MLRGVVEVEQAATVIEAVWENFEWGEGLAVTRIF